MNKNQEIHESLSANERKILNYLKENDVKSISKKTSLDEVAVLRALEYLSNKGIVKLEIKNLKIIDLGVNGVLYKQKGLPERRLINLIAEKKTVNLENAKKESGLSDNEFQAALGALKKKALLTLGEGNLIFEGKKEEITHKSLEEKFLEILPKAPEELEPEQKYAYESLKNRKNIIELVSETQVNFELTELGREIVSEAKNLKQEEMIEAITPEIISSNAWKNKKFRRYDITSPVPQISGGKRHFVNQSIDYARKIWTEMGFKEMISSHTQVGFWNFDALYTAQDHPVREIQDTFYIKDVKGKLPQKEIVNKIKESHEKGVAGSKGWRYNWKEQDAQRVLLRTHTTCVSAKTLNQIKKSELPQKFFAIGKCFRNETVDWSHGFEFNQTEGIVVDKNANFRNLLGYLKQFYKKMGFDDIKFIPSYFPYTEPSVEIYTYNKIRGVWVEVGGAGIFRPEVVVPLLGEYIPVLAWGPGFDRTLMEYYNIKDLRELYQNNLEQLNKMKFWMK
ncbi:phenylalanine--tRNA ligase subunit alpha [Candidatus Pacearchaeota archaeon]|nr:phenylalanine--tRNA ligase subunit alpha [Candidatus Pacearchaeota archaeon]